MKALHVKKMPRKKRILLTVLCVALSVCLVTTGMFTYAYLFDRPGTKSITFTKSTMVAPVVSHTAATTSAAMVPGNTISVSSYVKVATAANVATYLFVKVAKTGNYDAYLDYTYNSGWTKYSYTTTSTSATSANDIFYRSLASGTTGTYYIYSDQKVTVESNNNSDKSAAPTATVTAAMVQSANRTAEEAYGVISSIL